MANTYTTVEELKKHLNIEADFTEDDAYLLDLISVSEMAVFNHCNGGLEGAVITVIVNGEPIAALPKSVKHATMLLAAHLYNNRSTVSYAQAYDIPYAYKYLLAPYVRYTIG